MMTRLKVTRTSNSFQPPRLLRAPPLTISPSKTNRPTSEPHEANPNWMSTIKLRSTLSQTDEENEESFEGFPDLPQQRRKEVVAVKRPTPRPIPPRPRRYSPVDNGLMDAYAKTNRYMKYDVNRRHGPRPRAKTEQTKA